MRATDEMIKARIAALNDTAGFLQAMGHEKHRKHVLGAASLISELCAAPQPPLPSGAPDALAAGVLVEIEALEGTAAKVRNGASGDRVAAWIEMSVRGLRAAIAQAEAGTSGTSEPKCPHGCKTPDAIYQAGHCWEDFRCRAAASPEPSRQGVEGDA